MTTLTLRKMSSFVFDLTPDYKNIITYLAMHGSGNITKISQFTKNSEDYPLDRWAVKKRIYGSTHFQSLLDRDYLIEKIEDKHRFKKTEKTFYLTSKGILASFKTTSIKNNIAFRNVLDFANLATKGKKQSRFIQEFIISQIKYYLAYLYVQGTQLTWQNDFVLSYSKFIDYSEDGLDIRIKNKELMKEFKKIFEEYVLLRSSYYFLGGETFLSSDEEMPNLWKYIKDSNLPERNKIKKSWTHFVMRWFSSYQTQIHTEKEYRKIKHSDIPRFTDQEHIFSRLSVLEKQLIKKLKTFN